MKEFPNHLLSFAGKLSIGGNALEDEEKLYETTDIEYQTYIFDPKTNEKINKP